jgi:glycosyltransferase 2 family protein
MLKILFVEKMQGMKRILSLAMYALSTTLFVYFVVKTNPQIILKAIGTISLPLYLLCFFLFIADTLLAAVKWKILMRSFSWFVLVRMTFISFFYSLIFPGQIAGEAAKAYILARNGSQPEKIFSSVAIDKVTGLIGILIVGLCGLVLGTPKAGGPLRIAVVSMLAGSIGLLVAFRVSGAEKFFTLVISFLHRYLRLSRKALETATNLFSAAKDTCRDASTLRWIFVISIVYQLVCVVVLSLIASNLRITISFLNLCWIFCVISIAVLIPVSVGGLGVREGGFVTLLGLYGIGNDKAMSLSIAVFGLNIIGGIIGALFAVVPKRRIRSPGGGA